MGFADEIRELGRPKPTLAEWLIGLSSEDRAAFDEVVLGPFEPQWDPIIRLIRRNGGAVTRDTLRRYREKHVARR